jgi:hypothetical protein
LMIFGPAIANLPGVPHCGTIAFHNVECTSILLAHSKASAER